MTAPGAPPVPAPRPLWFGDPDRPLFGWLHLPAGGRAAASVLLCRPLGVEGECTGPTFRLLAERLAADGLVALRFDYDGTGDSAGSGTDPGRVPAWLGSIRQAADWLRRHGPPRVLAVGMRLGATLAALEGAADPFDGLVLWDPCASGRSYLRQQQALQSLSAGPAGDGGGAAAGSVEAPGITFARETVEGLGGADLAQLSGPPARRLLVLARPSRPLPDRLSRRLESFGATVATALGQEQLVDVEPQEAAIPHEAMADVRTWLHEGVDGPPVPLAFPLDGDTVALDGPAGAIVEQALLLGPLPLFAVVTRPATGAGGAPVPLPGDEPVVVFGNSGLISHVGPARLWVDLARRWAGAGLPVVRFDLSGLGDSPPHPGAAAGRMYPPEAFDDLRTVIDALCPGQPRRVVLAGLCSGGYHAVEGALALGTGGVCAVNPIFTAKPSEIAGPGVAATDPRRQATAARRRWVRRLPAHDLLGSLVERLPEPAWWLINRIAVEQRPARVLAQLEGAGIDTLLVCGRREFTLLARGDRRALAALRRRGTVRIEVLDGIDHALLAERARREVVPLVDRHVGTRYAARAAAGIPAGAPDAAATRSRPA